MLVYMSVCVHTYTHTHTYIYAHMANKYVLLSFKDCCCFMSANQSNAANITCVLINHWTRIDTFSDIFPFTAAVKAIHDIDDDHSFNTSAIIDTVCKINCVFSVEFILRLPTQLKNKLRSAVHVHVHV